METQFDYTQMAAAYNNCVIGLVGVSMTVLAIILSMDFANNPRIARSDVQKDFKWVLSILVASLIMAAACCLIGGQLLSKTASIMRPKQVAVSSDASGPQTNRKQRTPGNKIATRAGMRVSQVSALAVDGNRKHIQPSGRLAKNSLHTIDTGLGATSRPGAARRAAVLDRNRHRQTALKKPSGTKSQHDTQGGAKRLYQIASAVVFLAGSLFTFAMVLLPMTFSTDDWVQKLGWWTYCLMELGAWRWQISMVTQHRDLLPLSWQQGPDLSRLQLSLVGVLAFMFVVGKKYGLCYPAIPLGFSLATVLISAFHYSTSLNNASDIQLSDLCTYFFTAAIAPALLLGLCLAVHQYMLDNPPFRPISGNRLMRIGIAVFNTVGRIGRTIDPKPTFRNSDRVQDRAKRIRERNSLPHKSTR